MSRTESSALRVTRRALIAVAGGVAGSCLLQSAQAQGGAPTASPVAGAWAFSDDRGMTASLPQIPERVVAFSPIAGALWDLGVPPVAVFGPLTRPDGSPDPQVGNLDVSAVTWLGDWDAFDTETLIALQPDLLVGLDLLDVPGTLWYIPEHMYPTIAERVATIGFRLAPEDGVTHLFDRIEALAVALGADLTTEPQVAARDAFDTAVADLQATIADKPGLSVLVVSADTESLYVANPDWFGDVAFFRDLGLEIIAPATEERWQVLSWEEAGRYQPDFYLVDARSGEISPELATIATWQAQPAVQAGQVAPWAAVYPYGRQGFTPIVTALTEAITAADPDIAS